MWWRCGPFFHREACAGPWNGLLSVVMIEGKKYGNVPCMSSLTVTEMITTLEDLAAVPSNNVTGQK